jgi:hypothetical protein
VSEKRALWALDLKTIAAARCADQSGKLVIAPQRVAG